MNVGTDHPEMEYAIYDNVSREIYVYEGGVQRCKTTGECWFFDEVDETDIFTIERDGSTVRYLRNGRTFYTSAVPASGTYHVDTAMYYPDTRIGDVTLSFGDSGVSRNVYDAAGQRVLRVDPDGTKTLTLGSTELRWVPADPTTVQVARTYPGGTVRSFDGTVDYVVHGRDGSVHATFDSTTGAAVHTRYRPYGELRHGMTVNDRGFLNQQHDPTNLVYLNNRYHNPILGAFISVDPLVVLTTEPYTYASGSPATLSDPSGLFSCYVPDNPLVCQGDLESTWADSGTGSGYWYTNGSGSYLVSNNLGVTENCTTQGGDTCVTTWQLKLVGGFFPYIGEGIDGWDCLHGEGWSCVALPAPVVGGRFIDETADLVGGLLRNGDGAARGSDEAIEGATNTVAGLADDAVTTIGPKISGQMGSRGWTQNLIDDTLAGPSRTVITRDTRWTSAGSRLNDPATAYIRADGSYLVRNDLTGDIVQISNRNDPNWIAPWD